MSVSRAWVRSLGIAVTVLSAIVLSAPTATASTGAVTSQRQQPMIRVAGEATRAGLPVVSLNWSGYAATSTRQKFNMVQSTFIQPALKCPGVANQWTSNWVGLDGFNNSTVEQDGTFAFCGGPTHTTAKYVAWYEMYPQGSVSVFAVHPGDIIRVSVSYNKGMFALRVSDLTSGKTASHSAACSQCQRASAEWIIERPALCNNSLTKCFLTELANYGTTTMSGDLARLAGSSAKPISGFTNYPIFMIDPLKRGFISLDTVGNLVAAGSSFTAIWDRSGTTTPISL